MKRVLATAESARRGAEATKLTRIDADQSERLAADRTGGTADCRMIAYGPSTALPPVATAGGLSAETEGKSFEQH